eukprot:163608_1
MGNNSSKPKNNSKPNNNSKANKKSEPNKNSKPWKPVIDIYDPKTSKVNGDVFVCTDNSPNADYFATFACSIPLTPNETHRIKIRVIERVSYLNIGISYDLENVKFDAHKNFNRDGKYMYHLNGDGFVKPQGVEPHESPIKFDAANTGDTVSMRVDLKKYKLQYWLNDNPQASSPMALKKDVDYYFYVNTYKYSTADKVPQFKFLPL